MSRKGTSAVILSLLLGMLAMVSCGGSALTDLDAASENETLVAGPMVTNTPPTEKELMEWGGFDPGDSIYEEMPELNWEHLLYQSVCSGVNTLDLYGMVSHSDSTYAHYNGVIDELYIQSEAGEMGFALFGLRDVPDGEQIMAVRVSGEGYFGDDDEDGLYIAIGNAATGAYKWAGPYKNGEEWTVYNLMMDSVTDADHAFIVLAVYGGDAADIYNIEVEIGEHFVFVHPGLEFEIPEMIGPGPLDPGLHEYLEEMEIPIPLPDPPPGF